jgi:uncharacterized protein YdbL (DUF1318 family)
MMKQYARWQTALASLAVAACVTINVYFPAAAVEQAADKVISEVTSGSKAAPAGPGGGANLRRERSDVTLVDLPLLALDQALKALVPAANAQDEANIDISSPEIRAVTASMKARWSKLEPYFVSGAIGLTNDGRIDLRDQAAVPLPERALVRRLITEDNSDRATLYLEIAKANKHADWEPQIRKTFARRWHESEDGAKSGWYYQDDAGEWVKK